MILSLSRISLYFIAVVATATAQQGQGDAIASCRDPVSTATVLVDETITRIATTTVGLLPYVTATVLETVTSTLTNDAACHSPNSKRDIPDTSSELNLASLTESALYYHYRNPHLSPRSSSLPICPGPTSTTTSISTCITLQELTSTLSLTNPTAQTVTTTRTSIITATASSNACPIIPATNSQTDYTTNYTLYSRTCGRTLNYNNPGNTNPPVTLTIRAKVLACEAAAQCATAVMNQGAGYLSFDLHYRFANGWDCVMFFGRNRKAEYWDVVDEGVGEGYGYST